MKNIFYLLFFVLILFTGCAINKKSFVASTIQNGLNSTLFKQHQVGFSLYDLSTQTTIFAQDANKHFIPASNTKLLTFYAGLCALGDSVATIKYQIIGDSLLIWPQADPSFLHPNFTKQPAFDFLKNSNKETYLVRGTYAGQKFGQAWAWDDYNDYYATQITELPLYGNMVYLSLNNNKIKLQPDLVANFLSDTTYNPLLKVAQREVYNNNLVFPTKPDSAFKQKIPLNLDSKTTLILLSDTLLATGQVTKTLKTLPFRKTPQTAKTIYTTPADTLFKQMLQPSDNFIAEQLLMTIAYKNNLEPNQGAVIKYIKDNFLTTLPDTLQWVDGSGLSRINLNTPQNFIQLLNLIYSKAGEKRTFELLSAGGINGTLKTQFKGNTCFVYAKTGTLSNNYCLSGFLIGNSGKRYAFSFMNNNYTLPGKQIKQAVEQFITQIQLVL
ncbi:MAG: peptidase S13 [Sphingobacteriales bacterium]|nr:MAG: peptidase S13 [Sphingobacteriales bacterium]